jgi:hypothetical protein
VFLNHRARPDSVRHHFIARCLARASHVAPNLYWAQLHPHMRHSTVALLKSGPTCRRSATIWICQSQHDESVREGGSGDET